MNLSEDIEIMLDQLCIDLTTYKHLDGERLISFEKMFHIKLVDNVLYNNSTFLLTSRQDFEQVSRRNNTLKNKMSLETHFMSKKFDFNFYEFKYLPVAPLVSLLHGENE